MQFVNIRHLLVHSHNCIGQKQQFIAAFFAEQARSSPTKVLPQELTGRVLFPSSWESWPLLPIEEKLSGCATNGSKGFTEQDFDAEKHVAVSAVGDWENDSDWQCWHSSDSIQVADNAALQPSSCSVLSLEHQQSTPAMHDDKQSPMTTGLKASTHMPVSGMGLEAVTSRSRALPSSQPNQCSPRRKSLRRGLLVPSSAAFSQAADSSQPAIFVPRHPQVRDKTLCTTVAMPITLCYLTCHVAYALTSCHWYL